MKRMDTLTKYLTKEFIKLQLLCQVIFIFLFLMIDFVQKLDDFLGKKVTDVGVIISYFLYKIPYIMVQMIPVATLISVIVLFRLMKNNREITALKACGINIIKVSHTVIIISLFISLFTFLLSESVVPYTSSKSNGIWDTEIEKQDPTKFYGSDQIWYKTSDAIYWIKQFDSVRNIMENPVFHFFDDNFKLIKRIEAERATWQGVAWVLENSTVQEMQEDGGYRTSIFKILTLDIPETPDEFRKKIKQPEEMSYSQLKTYSETVKSEGYNNSGYLVDMGVKIAFPFISLVLTILGIPIALELKTGGLPLAIAAGIGLSFLYYVILSISSSLGHSGVFPPFLAAWTANLLFIFAGSYLMMTVEQ
ncbi:MAG: LPS export ABC transporter permease LptG [Deltaproteobacteria bacterium]|nr:LPS export ABC transporter permease LptG [Deltaproteobacteria bacterium]